MPYAPGNRPSYEPYQKTEKAKKARAQLQQIPKAKFRMHGISRMNYLLIA